MVIVEYDINMLPITTVAKFTILFVHKGAQK